jgi:hypothetical protein
MALTDMKGLFQNPAAIRAARVDELIKQQQSLGSMGGSMAGLLGQIAAGGSVMGGLLAEGIGQAAGLKTKEETQAEQASTIMQSIDPNKPETYFNAADALKKAGLTKAAFAMMEQGRTVAQDQAKAKLDQDKFKLEKDKFAQTKTEFNWSQFVDQNNMSIEQQNLALEQAGQYLTTELKIPSNVLAGADPTSVAKATNMLQELKPLQTVLRPAEYDRRLEDVRNAIKAKPTGSTTVTTSLEGLADLFNAEVTERGARAQADSAAEAYAELGNQALAGERILFTMNETKEALNSYIRSGGTGGVTAGFKQGLMKLAKGAGMDLPNNFDQMLESGEYLDWLANKGLASLAGTFKGSQSEKELKAIQDMTPEKRREPATLRRIVNILETEAYASQYVYNKAQEYRNSSETKTTVGFDAVGAAVDFNSKYFRLKSLTNKIANNTATPDEEAEFDTLGNELYNLRGRTPSQ